MYVYICYGPRRGFAVAARFSLATRQQISRTTRSSKDVSGRLIGVVPTPVLVPYFPLPLIQPITVSTLSKVWLSETRWHFYTIHAQPPLSVSRNLKYRRHPTATRTPRVTLMWYCSSVLPHNNKLNITKNICTNITTLRDGADKNSSPQHAT